MEKLKRHTLNGSSLEWVLASDVEELEAAKLEDEARIEELEAKLKEAQQAVTIAEQAQQDDLTMRLEARGFISDLYAERGQDARTAHLCNCALGLLRA